MILGNLGRCLALLGLLTGANAGAWQWLSADRAVGATPTLPDLVVAGAAWAVQLGLAWLTLLVALIAVEACGSRRELTGYAGCPAALRRLLLLACGAAVVGSLAAPSYADPGAGPAAGRDSGPATHGLRVDGLPLPDRATGSAPRSAPSSAPGAPRRGAPQVDANAHPADRRVGSHRALARARVVVRPGDSLWRIAADALERRDARAPTPAEIDRAWRVLYAANRDAIGSDPDLLHPGLVLHLPHPLHPKEPQQ